MITNDDHERGNENVALVGGVWDMHNEAQSLADYQKTRKWKGVYDPARYLGVLMRFNRVKNLHLRGLTLKDPVTFSTQLGNLDQFTIEDITFDHNLKRSNMDGIHVHGNSRFGRIADLKGATNDDMVALNADDGGIYEMSRGSIEDVVVDGVYAKDGFTAVRLLSAGSPIRRIRLANIFGTYRFHVISFTNHRVHPGSASTFEDIAIQGVFCSKSARAPDPRKSTWPRLAPIWIDAPATVSCLTISDYYRTESVWPGDNILIEPGATVDRLGLSNVSVINRTAGEIDVLTNKGTIGCLGMAGIYAKAEGGSARGAVVRNSGKIAQHAFQQVFTVNTREGIVEELRRP
jgi:hypothetical protein